MTDNGKRRPPAQGDDAKGTTSESARHAGASIPDPASGPAYIVARHLAGGRVHRRVFLTADAAARQLARMAARGASGSVHVAYLSPTPPEAPEAAQGAPEAAQAAPGVVPASYWAPDVAEDARSLMLAVLRWDPDGAEWIAAHSRNPRALALRLGRFAAHALADFLHFDGAARVVYGKGGPR